MLEVAEKPKDKLIMEWRTCPCGQSFKALSTSLQIYHNASCLEKDEGKTKKPIKNKMKPWESLDLDRQKHGEGVLRQEATPAEPSMADRIAAVIKASQDGQSKGEALKMEPIDLSNVVVVKNSFTAPAQDPLAVPEPVWVEAIGQAKGLIHTINKARFDIAALALKVCIIRKGGDQKTDKYKTGRSLKDFAKQIGVCHKTLCEWVRIKRNVIDKLPEGLYFPDKYAAAQRTACKVSRKAKPEVVVKAYKRELSDNSPQFYFDQLVRRTRLQANYLENPDNDLSKLTPESLQEMLDYTKRSLKVLKSHLES